MPKLFSKTQRVHGVETVFLECRVPGTGFQQHVAQGDMFQRTAVDLVAEFAGDRHAGDFCADQTDIDCLATEDRESAVRADILMRQAFQITLRAFGPASEKPQVASAKYPGCWTSPFALGR